MQESLVRLFRLEFLHHRNSISLWTICYACSLRSRIHLICNHVKTSRCLRETSTNAISQANVISYKVALRHTFMRWSHLLRNRSNSKHLHQHMFAKIFRVNLRSRHRSHLFLFLFDSRRFFTQLQSANTVKSVLSHIELAIDSCQMLQELRTLKYSWECDSRVSFAFVLLWKSIDSFRSHYFERVSMLFVCFTRFSLSINNRLFRHTLKKHWLERAKNCCFSLFSFCDLRKF